jgi:cellulose synthase/poly-beta-1,6-N-acetylglucosamine synthase-like glycosyltransferase
MSVRIFFIVLFVLAVLYMLLVLSFTAGWYRITSAVSTHRQWMTKVSVIIPFRNEEDNVKTLLEALLRQSFPASLVEFVFVNDHSEDNGKLLIENYITQHHLKNFRVIEAHDTGKKAALLTGIRKATGKLIVTTDADSLPPENWLSEVVSLYEEKYPRLILGPVSYQGETSLLQKLFSLDFMSLVASGAGSAGLGLPFMGNAANMAFEKEIYLEAGTGAQKGFTSGDDVFFIHYVRKKYGRKAIAFLKNDETIIRTLPPQNLQDFWRQRIRWASKARGYTQPWAIAVSYIIFLFNLFLTALLIVGFFAHGFWAIYVLMIILKTLIDFPLLYAFSRFSGKQALMWLVFPFEIIYPLYITFAAFRGLFPYQWKDRKWKR